MTRKIFLTILLSLLCCSFGFSQEETGADLAETADQAKTARKIDEFGRTNECDRSARLDNFLIELQNHPDTTGYILVYKDVNALPGDKRAYSYSRLYSDHLKFRKFDESRVVIIDAGFRESFVTELWVVPQGLPAPEPSSLANPPRVPEKETYIYHRQDIEYFVDTDQFLLQSVIDKRKQEKLEEEAAAAEDEAETLAADEPETEAEPEPEAEPVPDEEAANEEQEEETHQWLSDSFFDEIKTKKNATGVFIFYLDNETYDVNKSREYLEQEIKKTARSRDIKTDRFKVIFGGYYPEITLEMWVVPKNGKLPEPAPKERTAKETDTIDR
jgi:hypothetical protein